MRLIASGSRVRDQLDLIARSFWVLCYTFCRSDVTHEAMRLRCPLAAAVQAIDRYRSMFSGTCSGLARVLGSRSPPSSSLLARIATDDQFDSELLDGVRNQIDDNLL
ncbi:hypothetical protein pipiens_005389 [Culex pipiens pipiens]|uniref:Uncharacterized protein n=1 Tax=Culex pipiens pipiens TaxID=38569 RepID=A0ABD1DXH8_CULPP